jgi:hypothetical protein
MKLYNLYFLTCVVFYTTHPMQQPTLWIKTQNEELIEIEEVIAQESCLLQILLEEYAATYDDPLPIPLSTDAFAFLYYCLQQPVEKLNTVLHKNDFFRLIHCAEKLKCFLFYTQLMEQLIGKDLIDKITDKLTFPELDKIIGSKIVSSHKKCIKKSNTHRSTVAIINSKDGNYFVENITEWSSKPQITLWKTHPLQKMRKFIGLDTGIFCNLSKTLAIYLKKRAETFRLYSLESKNLFSNESNYQGNSITHVLFHPNQNLCCLTLKSDDQNNSHNRIVMRYSSKNHTIKAAVSFSLTHEDLIFSPDDKKIVWINDNKELCVSCPYDLKHQKKIYKMNTIPGHLESYHKAQNDLFSFVFFKNFNTGSIFFPKSGLSTGLEAQRDPGSYYGAHLKVILNPSKNLYCYNPKPSELCLMHLNGEIIATHDIGRIYRIQSLLFHPNGNYLFAIYDNGFYEASTSPHRQTSLIARLNLSDLAAIRAKTIDPQCMVYNINFIEDTYFISHGTRTIVWNMQGEKICTLGKNEVASSYSGNNLITAAHEKEGYQIDCNSCTTDGYKTKLYSLPNVKLCLEHYQEFKKSLLPSEKYLLNMYAKAKYKEFYPNLPRGRALACIRKKIEQKSIERLPNNTEPDHTELTLRDLTRNLDHKPIFFRPKGILVSDQ